MKSIPVGIGRLAAMPGKALVDLFTFGKPIETVQQETRQSLRELFVDPVQSIGSSAWSAVMKVFGSAKNAVFSSPVIAISG